MQSFDVTFHAPEHGWMVLDVRIGEHLYTLDVSDVPNDAISDLIESLVKLRNGVERVEVEYPLEPAYACMQFVASEEMITISIYVDDVLKIADTVPSELLHHSFLRALEPLANLDQQGAYEGETNWSWPFPAASYERYKEMVNSVHR